MSESASGEADSGTDVYDIDSLVCLECDKEYASNGGLRYHLRQYHQNSMVECPTCENRFLNERGMKTHHSQEHNVSIVGEPATCEWCGSSFRAKTSHGTRFCSQKCSRECESERHKENRPIVTCEYCGESERVKPYREDTHRFCSDECRFKWQSEYLVGEDNPNYDPESRNTFGPNWDEQAEKARKRDDYRCQDCGKHQSNHYRKLIAHHIFPRKDFIDADSNYDYERGNRLENLVSLCDSCHQRWEGLYLKPQLISK